MPEFLGGIFRRRVVLCRSRRKEQRSPTWHGRPAREGSWAGCPCHGRPGRRPCHPPLCDFALPTSCLLPSRNSVSAGKGRITSRRPRVTCGNPEQARPLATGATRVLPSLTQRLPYRSGFGHRLGPCRPYRDPCLCRSRRRSHHHYQSSHRGRRRQPHPNQPTPRRRHRSSISHNPSPR